MTALGDIVRDCVVVVLALISVTAFVVCVLVVIGVVLTARANRAKRLHRRERRQERTQAQALAVPTHLETHVGVGASLTADPIDLMEHEWTPAELVELGLAIPIPDSEWMTGCVMLIDPFAEPWRLTY